MPYCSKCGAEVDFNAQYCPKCGSPLSTGSYQPSQKSNWTDPNDSGSIGWFILGFIIPLVGLILFFVWSQTRPKSAKMSGLGALVGFLCGILFSVIYTVALIGILSSSSPDAIQALL